MRKGRRNLATALKTRVRAGNPLAEFDALPAAARAWARGAVLPWSARSIARIWARGMREGGAAQALALLARAEAMTLAREGRL